MGASKSQDRFHQAIALHSLWGRDLFGHRFQAHFWHGLQRHSLCAQEVFDPGSFLFSWPSRLLDEKLATFHKLKLIVNSTPMCPQNYCLDESIGSNQKRCVADKHCNKLVAYFQIDERKQVFDSYTCLTDSDDWRWHLLNAPLAKGSNMSLRNDFVGCATIPNRINLENINLPYYLIEFYDLWETVKLWILLATCLCFSILTFASLFIAWNVIVLYQSSKPLWAHIECLFQNIQFWFKCVKPNCHVFMSELFQVQASSKDKRFVFVLSTLINQQNHEDLIKRVELVSKELKVNECCFCRPRHHSIHKLEFIQSRY